MQVKNCRECGRLFNYLTGLQLCPACRENLDNKFNEVKAYIRENKNATVKSVSEDCDVDERYIRQWVREERLVFSNPSIDTGIVCEICGKPITTGKYCDDCKTSTINDLKSLTGAKQVSEDVVKKSSKDGPRMRFLDRK